MTPAECGISPRLAAAYYRTVYQAAGVAMRIGRRSAALDSLLQGLGTRQGVFITAWNPLSHPMPPGWNHRMQRALRQRLRRVPVLTGRGVLHRWEEEHVLAAADPGCVLRLARLFRQRAVLALRQRHPVRLVLLAWPDPGPIRPD